MCAQGECLGGALGCSGVGAGGALGVQAQGACLGCAPGVQTRRTRAVSSGCDLGVLSGFTLGVQPWAGSPGRELEALLGCRLGVLAQGVRSGALPQSWGAVAGPLSGGRWPRVAVPPRMVVCFRKWLWHVAVLTGASGSPSAPAPERTKASREGRPRGTRVELGVPPLWEGLRCDIPRQRCAAVGTWVTCFPLPP